MTRKQLIALATKLANQYYKGLTSSVITRLGELPPLQAAYVAGLIHATLPEKSTHTDKQGAMDFLRDLGPRAEQDTLLGAADLNPISQMLAYVERSLQSGERKDALAKLEEARGRLYQLIGQLKEKK